jgi:DNA-binding MarR family transcriptional regulator
LEYNELFDTLFDGLKTLMYPEEWISIDLYVSKSELLTLMQVDRNGEIIMSRIADYINIPMSTATGLVERLVKKGLLERSRSDSDRRIVAIRLTDEGRKLTAGFKETVNKYIRLIYDALTEEERELLLGIFTKIGGIISKMSENRGPAKEASTLLKKIEIE